MNIREKLKYLDTLKTQRKNASKAYLQRQQKANRKQISAIISNNTHNYICMLRDRSIKDGNPLTTGQIIDALVEQIQAGGANLNSTLKQIKKDPDAWGRTWADRADKLNRDGITTETGKPWSKDNLRKTVNNLS